MSKICEANMTPMEDEALCRSYMHVNIDSINNANQTIDRLWEVVSAIYHQQPGIVVARTLSSLQSRYQ